MANIIQVLLERRAAVYNHNGHQEWPLMANVTAFIPFTHVHKYAFVDSHLRWLTVLTLNRLTERFSDTRKR